MTKKIFAISLLLIITSMIILSLMPLQESSTEVKEEEKRQKHGAYAASSSPYSLPSTDFNFAAVGDWACSKSTYNIDFISRIIRAIGHQSSDLVTIEYSSNKPLRLEFLLSGMIRLRFYLAPRVQD
jgi:hypothetical protein